MKCECYPEWSIRIWHCAELGSYVTPMILGKLLVVAGLYCSINSIVATL